MTATNHTVTGALIGSVVGIPIISLPLAFLSHFLLDSLPHYDISEVHTDKKFLYSLAADCGIALGILLAILVLAPYSSNIWIALAGVAGASPDLMWIENWLRELTKRPQKKLSKIAKIHTKIQKHAKHSIQTFIFELIWFVIMMTLLIISIGR